MNERTDGAKGRKRVGQYVRGNRGEVGWSRNKKRVRGTMKGVGTNPIAKEIEQRGFTWNLIN